MDILLPVSAEGRPERWNQEQRREIRRHPDGSAGPGVDALAEHAGHLLLAELPQHLSLRPGWLHDGNLQRNAALVEM